MEEENGKPKNKKNCVTDGLPTEISTNFSWHVNLSTIDLSNRNLETIDDKIQFPAILLELNLSHNKLVNVPAIVTKISNLKKLNLSHNFIENFDEIPNFCHTLEHLDLSNNNLHGPPYWIWKEKPKQLLRVNFSCNTNITQSFVNGYFEELLQYKTLVMKVDLHNCGIRSENLELLATFTKAETIIFGNNDFNFHGANIVGEMPSKGLEKCCDVKKLNFSNTHIHTINKSIEMLINLSEINLACNNLNSLPNEFCNLANLEICVLSHNRILYLPEDMVNLKKLVKLCVDSNELCMLPEKFRELTNLKVLDLYDNHLNEIFDDYSHLEGIDFAQNYLQEPEDADYLEKREKLRLQDTYRSDGRKPEVVQPESEYTSVESDDEEYYRELYKGELPLNEPQKPTSVRSSSPEDWDSDAHWIPHDIRFPAPSPGWIHFINKKMKDGNFCPVDAHVVSISDQVMFQKKSNPKFEVEIVGQFDDYSSDDS